MLPTLHPGLSLITGLFVRQTGIARTTACRRTIQSRRQTSYVRHPPLLYLGWSNPIRCPPIKAARQPEGQPADYQRHHPVLFPSSPSPFVSVAGRVGLKEVCEVWDLRTMQRVGMIVLDGPFSSPALSPDGVYLAALVSGAQRRR